MLLLNFDALATIIDDLGGLDMDMSYAEIVHMNNYCVETAEDTVTQLHTNRTSGKTGRSGKDPVQLSSERCTGNILLPYPLHSKP